MEVPHEFVYLSLLPTLSNTSERKTLVGVIIKSFIVVLEKVIWKTYQLLSNFFFWLMEQVNMTFLVDTYYKVVVFMSYVRNVVPSCFLFTTWFGLLFVLGQCKISKFQA